MSGAVHGIKITTFILWHGVALQPRKGKKPRCQLLDTVFTVEIGCCHMGEILFW
jgi:hypothetical protein